MLTGLFFNDRLFNVAEALFPFALKILADGAAEFAFNGVIGVNERELEPPSELATYCGFAGTR